MPDLPQMNAEYSAKVKKLSEAFPGKFVILIEFNPEKPDGKQTCSVISNPTNSGEFKTLREMLARITLGATGGDPARN